MNSFEELSPQDLAMEKLKLFTDFNALWPVTQTLSHGFLSCGSLVHGGEEAQQNPLHCLFYCQKPKFVLKQFSPSLEIANEHCAGRNRQQSVVECSKDRNEEFRGL